MNKTNLLILLFIFSIILSCNSPNNCKKDKKICPDGSKLDRQYRLGCEFPSCPIVLEHHITEGELCSPEFRCERGMFCKEGTCHLVTENVCSEPRPNNCLDTWQPVCGSNQNTYENACKACMDRDVYFWFNSRCPFKKCDSSITGCGLTFAPVCGSDDITYNNACSACASGAEEFSVGRC